MSAVHTSANGAPLGELKTVMLRGRWFILATLLVFTAIAGIYTVFVERVYESTAMILIDAKSGQRALPFRDAQGIDMNSKITNEMETLKSNAMAEAVARTLLQKTSLDSTGTQRIPILQTEQPEDTNLATVAEVMKRLKKSVDFIRSRNRI